MRLIGRWERIAKCDTAKAGPMAQKPGPSMEFWCGVILCLVLVTAGRLLLIGV
jgi:hypothetical protein